MSATMYRVIRYWGTKSDTVHYKFIGLPLITALLDEPLKYMVAPPPEDEPEPEVPTPRKPFERRYRDLGSPLE